MSDTLLDDLEPVAFAWLCFRRFRKRLYMLSILADRTDQYLWLTSTNLVSISRSSRRDVLKRLAGHLGIRPSEVREFLQRRLDEKPDAITAAW